MYHFIWICIRCKILCQISRLLCGREITKLFWFKSIEICVEMNDTLSTYFHSIVMFLTCPVLCRDSAMYIHFSVLSIFCDWGIQFVSEECLHSIGHCEEGHRCWTRSINNIITQSCAKLDHHWPKRSVWCNITWQQIEI